MQRAKRYVVYGAPLLFSCLYIYKNRLVFADLLGVVLLSSLFAAMLSPICSAAEKKGMPPAAAAGFSLLILLCSILLFASVFIPYLAAQVIDLVRRSLPVLSHAFERLSSLSAFSSSDVLESTEIPKLIVDSVGTVTSGLTSIGLTIASKIGILCFSLVIAYYLLKERRLLCGHILLFVPSAWRGAFLSALHSCVNSIMSYLSAMIKTSLFVTGLTYPALLILGIPNALLLSLLMGLMEILPYVGPVVASVPILLSCLPLGMHTVLAALILLILIQQIEGNLVSPYFAASSTSIHPLTALVSVFVFGRLLGIAGILFAVPIIVIIRCLFWSLRQTRNLMKA